MGGSKFVSTVDVKVDSDVQSNASQHKKRKVVENLNKGEKVVGINQGSDDEVAAGEAEGLGGDDSEGE